MRRLLVGLMVFSALLHLGSQQIAAQVNTAASESAVAGVEPALNGLDAYIAAVMEEWKVPGLAIAVIKDGEVVLSEGYGYRNVDEQLPVTPRTLFAIGSITKSFTVTVLGMLEDEGLVDWDTPVRTYLPDFQLYDEYVTLHMTPRDLVTHRSGLPRHDLTWYGSDATRQELFDRLRYLEPSRGFREVWQYQNLMFMTAGYLAGNLAGMPWESMVRERIFEPLGMERSNFSVTESPKSDDFSYPYTKNGDDVRQVPFRNIDEIGPAGSINSSVEEMIRYVQFHIDKGKWNGEQLLSERNAEAMQTPQMAIQSTITSDELGHSAYGLGLGISSYRGHKVVSHGGGIDGFIALMSFMPRDNIGMIILSNLSGNNPVPTIVQRRVYDDMLGLEPVDWLGRVKERQARAEEAEEAAEEHEPRVEGTSPSHALEDYAGSYEHPGYGILKFEVEDDRLKGTFNNMSAPFEHYHYDVFEVPENPLDPFEGTQVLFLYNKKGEVDRVAVPLEPNVDDIIFTRVPDETMRERAFLEPFEGVYELAGQTATVALRGDDTLTLTVPGQPTYELVPTRGTSFDLKGMTGFSVEFKGDELVFYQPNGTFVAKRK